MDVIYICWSPERTGAEVHSQKNDTLNHKSLRGDQMKIRLSSEEGKQKEEDYISKEAVGCESESSC